MRPQCSTVAPLDFGTKGVPNPGTFPTLREVCLYNFKAQEKMYLYDSTHVQLDSTQLRGQVASMWRCYTTPGVDNAGSNLD